MYPHNSINSSPEPDDPLTFGRGSGSGLHIIHTEDDILMRYICAFFGGFPYWLPALRLYGGSSSACLCLPIVLQLSPSVKTPLLRDHPSIKDHFFWHRSLPLCKTTHLSLDQGPDVSTFKTRPISLCEKLEFMPVLGLDLA